MKRLLLGATVALGFALSAMACEGDKAGTTTTKTETKTESTSKTAGVGKTVETKTTTETKTTEIKPTEAKPGDVGVAECDDYLLKMSDCSTKMAPAAAGPVKESLATTRKAWKEAASTPEGRTALAASCKQARDTAKSAYASAGCAF